MGWLGSNGEGATTVAGKSSHWLDATQAPATTVRFGGLKMHLGNPSGLPSVCDTRGVQFLKGDGKSKRLFYQAQWPSFDRIACR
jgi:hypothetical protein